jgi:hypothetical protein
MSKTKSITAYNLYDFSVGVQEAVLEGYRLSTDNSNFPVQLGPSLYTCVMILEDVTEEVPRVMLNVTTGDVEVTAQQTKGRTKKAAKE